MSVGTATEATVTWAPFQVCASHLPELVCGHGGLFQGSWAPFLCPAEGLEVVQRVPEIAAAPGELG